MSHHVICLIPSDFTLIDAMVGLLGKSEGSRKIRKSSVLLSCFPISLFPYLEIKIRKRDKNYKAAQPSASPPFLKLCRLSGKKGNRENRM